MYGVAKSIAPEKPIGWHIVHNNTLNPFYRVEEDFSETENHSDFIKAAIYNNAGGPRTASFVKQLGSTLFHDARPEDFLPFYYKIMSYNEAPYEKLAVDGLSTDYVYRGTKRAVSGLGADAAVCPGIDVDVPTAAGQKQTVPNDLRKAAVAAFSAGAEGIIVSCRYSEMRLANLAGAGQGLR